MTELPVDRPPDPLAVAGPAQFVERLRELRVWAGEPALRRLRHLAGTTVDAAGRRIDALPVSTTSSVLRGDRLPRMEFVRAFVTACLRVRQRCPEEITEQVERWHSGWLRLYHTVLPANGAATPARTAVSAPRQLPADVAGFAGRTGELASLESIRAAADRPGSPVVWTIDGAAGVGKSALAIHAAHRLADAFPDGQLYVDLQDATIGLGPLEPVEVLGRFLRAVGVAGGDIPDQVDEAAARFRTQLAGRHLLLVLDNARDEAQVRPLLPGTPGCGVLVTSRRPLPGLSGAGQVHLAVLPEPAAMELLGSMIGRERVAAEPAAAAKVVRSCDRLPLALRIAGARLSARSGWSVAALADRLADEQRRLDELQVAKIGVRASFDLSYRQLIRSRDPTDQAAARAFGLLGIWDGPELGVPMAARLLDRSTDESEQLLERLVDAQLLETPAAGRYRLHDLLRLYARESATRTYDAPDRLAALDRVLRWYAATSWQTMALLRPGDHRLSQVDESWTGDGLELDTGDAAVTWLETERSNLVSAVDQAARDERLAPAAVQLAQAMFGFFLAIGLWRDCVRVNQVALTVAQRLGHRSAQARAHSDIGGAHHLRGRYNEALPHIRASLDLYRDLGDRPGEAASLSNLGIVYAHLGPYQDAVRALESSVDIREALGFRKGVATSLGNLGLAHGRYGRYTEAVQCLLRSLELHRELDDRRGEANSLDSLGQVHHRRRRYAAAVRCYRDSLGVRRQLAGDHHHAEAETLRNLGESLRQLGRTDEARIHWREALAIYDQLQVPYADDVRTLLAAELRT